MEKTTKTSIDKLDEQIKNLSNREKKSVETGRVNKKDLVRKAKLKELDEKVEKNRKKNSKNKTSNVKNRKKNNNKNLNNKIIDDVNEKKLEDEIRDLYKDNELEKTKEIEVLSDDVSLNVNDTIKIPVVDDVINKFDEKLASVKILGDDAYSKLIIFLFFVFMFLILFYIIFFMALSFA